MNRTKYLGYRRNGQSLQHRRMVVEYLEELENEGWKVIDLHDKSPDGIAVKDNKVVAVEVLLTGKNSKYGDMNKKKSQYFMFDDIFFRIAKKKPIPVDNQGWELQPIMSSKSNMIEEDL